jgi:D-arabinose 1-dehydrogenase-like Zn-dependent alcohol dehydrogenase
MSAPSTTRAYVVRKAGQPSDVLKLESDWPLPIPAKDEVLVNVEAVALNRERRDERVAAVMWES